VVEHSTQNNKIGGSNYVTREREKMSEKSHLILLDAEEDSHDEGSNGLLKKWIKCFTLAKPKN
jgi:hypothetical protein